MLASSHGRTGSPVKAAAAAPACSTISRAPSARNATPAAGRVPSFPIQLREVRAGASARAAPYATRRPATATAACLARDIEALDARGDRVDVAPRRRAVSGLRQHKHHVSDAALRKPRLAPAQVQRPQPLEAPVVAELRGPIEVRDEALAPAPQRLGVVRRQVLEAHGLHVGSPR